MSLSHDPRFPYRNELEMPVVGLEAEFKVFIDDEEVVPEEVWRTPAAFIDQPMLQRTSKASQLPTGGAVYFDGGVIEVVTPVIEIGPQCTARVVRSLWEQISFVRDQLDRWEGQVGKRVRLQAFSCHINISFELGRDERSSRRTIQKLAVLLSHLLPVPSIVLGSNRRSTGIGVRPRRERIEVTMDFTPDPGLMAATTALVVGIAREVISWDSYLLDELDRRGIARVEGLEPGKHPTRKGWIARASHFPRNPFAGMLDAPKWRTTDGRAISLRGIALEIADAFRDSIRAHADMFSYRLLFSVLRGETPSLLDLRERPPAYDDVGRSTRWGTVLPELQNYAAVMTAPQRRLSDMESPWQGELTDRRRAARGTERRMAPPPAPGRGLTRSAYEKVFLNLGRRRPLKIGGELLTPIAVKGWYHSVFVTPKGEERLLSIDQLLEIGGWQ